MEIYFLNSSNEKLCTLCWALFGQMAVCRWGCVWQMSPGGRWSRVPGERGRVCAGQIPADVWISVGVLDGTGSGVACAQRDELSHDAEQRYHGKRCVWVWFILFEAGLVLSLQTHWSVGGIFFHTQGGTGNDPVLWAAAFVFILILVPLLLCVFLGGFCICLPHIQWPWKRKYSCSICLQAVNDQWVWSGGTRLPRRPCVHWLPLQRRASSGFTWNK